MNARMCFVLFFFSSSGLFVASKIIMCLFMVRTFYHSRGMFCDKEKEWIMVIIYSCIALTIDSTYFCALSHVILFLYPIDSLHRIREGVKNKKETLPQPLLLFSWIVLKSLGDDIYSKRNGKLQWPRVDARAECTEAGVGRAAWHGGSEPEQDCGVDVWGAGPAHRVRAPAEWEGHP